MHQVSRGLNLWTLKYCAERNFDHIHHWILLSRNFYDCYSIISTAIIYFPHEMPQTNFGLRSRSTEGTARATSSTNPWTQVNNRNQGGVTGGIAAQDIRAQISTKYITYCTFALGYDRKKPPPAKSQLVRHILSILRHGDGKLGLLPYDKTSKANAICHATSVPNSPVELAIYFPDFTHYLRRFRTKCRITSELHMWQIKSNVFPELRANDFWMNPTSLKCQTSEKCGFFSLCPTLYHLTERLASPT